MRRLLGNARSARARRDCSLDIARFASLLIVPCNFSTCVLTESNCLGKSLLLRYAAYAGHRRRLIRQSLFVVSRMEWGELACGSWNC
jgi:hypothetical protein